MRRMMALRDAVFAAESEQSSIDDCARDIWKIFPEKNETSLDLPRAMTMRGSLDWTEVLQVLEEYFERAEACSAEHEIQRQKDDEEKEAEIDLLKKSISTALDDFPRELEECRAQTLEDMKQVVNERFDYMQECVAKANESAGEE